MTKQEKSSDNAQTKELQTTGNSFIESGQKTGKGASLGRRTGLREWADPNVLAGDETFRNLLLLHPQSLDHSIEEARQSHTLYRKHHDSLQSWVAPMAPESLRLKRRLQSQRQVPSFIHPEKVSSTSPLSPEFGYHFGPGQPEAQAKQFGQTEAESAKGIINILRVGYQLGLPEGERAQARQFGQTEAERVQKVSSALDLDTNWDYPRERGGAGQTTRTI